MSNNTDHSPTVPPSSGGEQDRSRERLPLHCAVTSYVITRQQPVPQEVQDEVAAFISHEDQLAAVATLPEAVARQRLGAHYNHAKSWGYLLRRLGANPPATVSSYEDDGGLLLIAREAGTNRMMGFSSVFIQSAATVPVPRDAYTGVGTEYTGRGVGGALFLVKALCLANLGIPSMDVSVWEASEAMIRKVGIEPEVIPPVVYPGLVTSADPQLRIPLNTAVLASLCEERLGFTPDPSNFTGTCQFVLNPMEAAGPNAPEQ